MISILICEDERIMRWCLSETLGMEPEIVVVGEAANGREAVEMTALLMPDIVLMDVRMPVMNGVDATRIITSQYPKTRVVILSSYAYAEYVYEGVKAGAMGYVLKDSDPQDLLHTIQRIHRGERFIQAGIASEIVFQIAKLPERPAEDPGREILTNREIAVLSCLAQGKSTRDVAHDLKLSAGTVRNYVSNILSKLQANNRMHAVNLARQRKII